MNYITRSLNYISAVGIFCMAVLIFVSVFFRYFLNHPINLTEDLTTYFLGFTVFAAYPVITVQREHIKVDLLAGIFQKFPRVNYLREALIDLVTLGTIVIVALRIWERAEKALARGTVSETMEWLLWPALYAFVALLLLSCVLFAAKIIFENMKAYSSRGTDND